MEKLLVYHNPGWGKSRGALELLRERDVACDVIEYMKSPLDRATLEHFLDLLPDPPSELVRKDKKFKELGLADEDYQTREQVVGLLLEHPVLMQRPVIIRGKRAVIARPSDKVLELLDWGTFELGTRDRKRPDESRKPGQITPEGYEALQRQSEELWKQSRIMATAVGVAAAEGDRSENAEYIYGKMKLGQIHGKLRFLGNRLNALTIVPLPPPDDGRVHFGCWVKLEGDEDGSELVYRIVGPDETDIERGYISAESPMALALLGKELDDEVVVKRPKGDLCATIVAIEVREPAR